MAINAINEQRFASDIKASFLFPAGWYVRGSDVYDLKLGLYTDTLIAFIRKIQPGEWARFENVNRIDTVRNFCTAKYNAIMRALGRALYRELRESP